MTQVIYWSAIPDPRLQYEGQWEISYRGKGRLSSLLYSPLLHAADIEREDWERGALFNNYVSKSLRHL